ncbi:MAG TPA: hypothetical protein VHT73_05265 [Thermodesulfobacteriota bacterium]|nr:hypothetical protein [Thermodesulfobacteriota bacterium]
MDKLKEYRKYFMQNIYELDECLLLIQSIANQSGDINKTRFAKALGRIQSQLFSNLILLITKCFDKPDSKHPTVSIRSILELLKDSKDEIEITSIKPCKRILMEFGINLDESVQDKAEFIDVIAEHYNHKINGYITST